MHTLIPDNMVRDFVELQLHFGETLAKYLRSVKYFAQSICTSNNYFSLYVGFNHIITSNNDVTVTHKEQNIMVLIQYFDILVWYACLSIKEWSSTY